MIFFENYLKEKFLNFILDDCLSKKTTLIVSKVEAGNLFIQLIMLRYKSLQNNQISHISQKP